MHGTSLLPAERTEAGVPLSLLRGDATCWQCPLEFLHSGVGGPSRGRTSVCARSFHGMIHGRVTDPGSREPIKATVFVPFQLTDAIIFSLRFGENEPLQGREIFDGHVQRLQGRRRRSRASSNTQMSMADVFCPGDVCWPS